MMSFSVPWVRLSAGTKHNKLSLQQIYEAMYFLHFNVLECVWVCVCMCVQKPLPSLEWINSLLLGFSQLTFTNQSDILSDAHIPCLCEVDVGALPALISPEKNDVFILANRRISWIATPVHHNAGWSGAWSLTMRYHSIWQRDEHSVSELSIECIMTERNRLSCKVGEKIKCRAHNLRRSFCI